MMEIILSVCSLVQGAKCTEAHLTFPNEGQFATPYGCLIGGIVEASKWQEANPNWYVAKWRCDHAGRTANI